MKRTLIALTFVLLASPTLAQHVLMTVNLSDHSAVAAYPVDDDGNPNTPEAWLLEIGVTTFTPSPTPFGSSKRFQLVVPTASGLCSEDIFIVETSMSTITREKMAGRTVLIHKKLGFFNETTMSVISLDRKRCR